MHVVDATLFFSPTSGGVKRYLLAKHEWMRTHTNWRHTLVVPGDVDSRLPGGISTIAGGLVPGAFNYRLGDAFHPAWAAASVASRRGIPLIAFYHSNFPQLAGRRLGGSVQKLIEWYVKLTYERCAQVLAPSRYMVDYLHSIGVRHATCHPLGVDTEVFSPARRGRDLRAELELPARTRLLVFAGRCSREKNIPALEQAFARLGRGHHLLLIGGGAARRDGNVTRIPYCRDNETLASWFAAADGFVHAGKHETFGLVLLEAMACGRPVVAMRAGAVPELVPESAGILATPHEDVAIAAANVAEAVSALYERDLDALGVAARAHVEANYSWSRTLQQLMTRYQVATGVMRAPAMVDALKA
jgi:alpha-1,6-mannosyltransferase